MSLSKILAERKRMDFNTFTKRVKEYMDRKGINLNGAIPNKDLRQGYDDGLYPSEFVKKYVQQLNDNQKRGGFGLNN